MPTFLNTPTGQYQLGRTLGSGVSCKVKLAKDEQNNRFAIKLIKGSDFSDLVQAELDVLKKVSHPHVVKMHEAGKGTQTSTKKKESKEIHYIVLELAQGGELFDFIALGGKFEEDVARLYSDQFLQALEYMHSVGICHRDLKPENLMLDGSYNLKVADFGFAAPVRGRDGSGKLYTQLGTKSYMAPEIHMGKAYDGPLVDVFAFGIILFVALTQRPPFAEGSPDDPHYRLLIGKRGDMFWNAHAEAEGEDIYSKEFKQLFEGCVAFNPKERLTAAQIRAHPWMKGKMASIAGIKQEFDERKAAVDKSAHDTRDEKRKDRANRMHEKKAGTAVGRDKVKTMTAEDRKRLLDQWGELEIN